MEDQAASLLATLKRPTVPIDQKIKLFNDLKSAIKHLRVPEGAQINIFECLRLAIASQASSTLVSTGLSTLSHYIKRLGLQSQTSIIAAQSKQLLPVLQDRLADPREGNRIAAQQALSDLWPYNHAGVEGVIREGALGGTNSKAKEHAMQWVVKMHATESLPFKSFVPYLVANLEDSDGAVRETAKSAVVELFRNAPDRAKNDLKKQLSSHNVRKTIANYIVANLGLPGSVEVDLKASTASAAPAPAESEADAHAPPPEALTMDPMYVYTQRELDEMFRDMLPHFEGRETEHNWLARDRNVTKLRRLLKGNAPTEYLQTFVPGIKSLLDGIIKVATSLRTTMSTNGCQLVQELAKTLGPAIDHMVEILLQTFIKMSANTKSIAAQNGFQTVDTIFAHTTYTPRMMQHVGFAVADKNVQVRSCAAGWIKTLCQKNTTHKAQFEHNGGLDAAITLIKKGLGDANPKVKEGFRSTYWAFAKIWPDKGESIMETLDPKQQSALQRDPNNPNAAAAGSTKGTMGRLKSQPSRSSLRDAIAAQRAAARKIDRPNSAQSTFSPVKSMSAAGDRHPAGSLAKSTNSRPPSSFSTSRGPGSQAPSSTNAGGTLTSKPRRPRMVPRPQTADPYAARNKDAQAATPDMSPSNSPEKSTTARKYNTMKGVSRPRAPTGSRESPAMSPVRSKSRLEAPGHRKTPSVESPPSSPSKPEDFTMVVPMGQRMDEVKAIENAANESNAEDTFTMVIPKVALSQSENVRPAQVSSPQALASRPLSDALDISSPQISALTQGSKSSILKSPERSQTPANGEEVKVFEDPFVENDGTAPQPSTDDKPVLEEVPVNEQNRIADADVSQANGESQKTAEANGQEVVQDRAEVLRTRRLLSSGIERIKAKSLDAHGFRRLQEVVKGNLDIWGERDERFGELVLAMLEYLEAPTDPKTPSIKAMNLKTQVLSTIRAMISLHRKKAAPYNARALCSVISARAQWGPASHITVEIEKTADEIVRNGDAAVCIGALSDLLESLARDTPSSSSPASPASPVSPDAAAPNANRSTTLALHTVSTILTSAPGKAATLTEEQARRLGRLAVSFLTSLDPDVRRADMEFCVALYERLSGADGEETPEDKDKEKGSAFWRALAGADAGHVNLITYYLARKVRS
ncbi:clasp N terminal-domain-containing protein [Phyllosticta citriasiana]|uniref:clasp N terminal-domain-containing protein n=1 Tax=Phyllosticta citriasiana TaxID=595635 RepID=UPI0030FD6DC4